MITCDEEESSHCQRSEKWMPLSAFLSLIPARCENVDCADSEESSREISLIQSSIVLNWLQIDIFVENLLLEQKHN